MTRGCFRGKGFFAFSEALIKSGQVKELLEAF